MVNLEQKEIMNKWNKSYKFPLVSIKCMTYNHEKYISNALDGFLLQRTTFPFEIIVHDDASTDKTAEIIREYENKYPDIIKPIYETENQYSNPNSSVSKIMYPYLTGKYIAFCEGDDYWIDVNKLQMQIDFLEAHSEYAMCYTKARQFFENTKLFSRHSFGEKIRSYEELFIYGCKIPTPTVVCRKSCLDSYNTEFYNKVDVTGWKMGDLPQWLYFFRNFKVKYFSKKTAVYRILQESASHTIDNKKKELFQQSTITIRASFLNFYQDFNNLDIYIKVFNFDSAWNNRDYKKVCELFSSIPNKFRTKKMYIKFLIAFIKRNKII